MTKDHSVLLKNLHPSWRNNSFQCQLYLAYMGENSLAKNKENRGTSEKQNKKKRRNRDEVMVTKKILNLNLSKHF